MKTLFAILMFGMLSTIAAHAADGWDWGYNSQGQYVYCFGWKDYAGTHWCY